MARYKVNKAEKVNTRCSKNGIKWRYAGTVENWQKAVEDWVHWHNRWTGQVAIRITDTETGEIVCEKWAEEEA